jgi:predicted ArsR family transcriptional regulator
VTNRQRLLSFLKQEGSITALEGATKLRPPMTSVSQEITRLEQDGIEIEHVRQDNEETHWTRYYLRPGVISEGSL